MLAHLCQCFNPGKIEEVDRLLAKYPGRERDVVAAVMAKYGPPPTTDPRLASDVGIEAARPSISPESTTRRLTLRSAHNDSSSDRPRRKRRRSDRRRLRQRMPRDDERQGDDGKSGARDAMMQVYFLSLGGMLVSIRVSGADTILALKGIIQSDDGIPH